MFLLSIILCSIIFKTFKFFFSFCHNKNEIKNNTTILKKEKINLTGRVKRNPNNINYSEIFNDNEKIKIKKYKKNDEEKEVLLETNCNNLDEFFDRVKERNDFEKIFKTDSIDANNNNDNNDNNIKIINQNNQNDNLIIFENSQQNNQSLKFNDLSNKTEIKNIYSLIKNKDKLSEIKETNEDELNDSSRIEEKLKNSGLFYQTPLANIKRNIQFSK